MKYRKKLVVIEAIQWDGTHSGLTAIVEVFKDIKTLSSSWHKERNTVTSWKIRTLEGGHYVSEGDFIIRGVAGEYYPCKPDIFEKTYDPAE